LLLDAGSDHGPVRYPLAPSRRPGDRSLEQGLLGRVGLVHDDAPLLVRGKPEVVESGETKRGL